MSLLRKLLVVAVLGIVAYCFWPRESSALAPKPTEIATLQTNAAQQARLKQWVSHGATMYKIYEGQYRLPPFTALMTALDQTRAVSLQRTGATDEDKEKAAGPLRQVFATLKDKAGAACNPTDAAALELQLWGATADPFNDELALRAQSGVLAQVYGGDPAKYLPCSRLFVQARKEAASSNWKGSQTTLTTAWTELHKIVLKK